MIIDKIEDAFAWLSRYTLGENFADYCATYAQSLA